ncbi:hypothetical protein RGU12_04380 [Fredinandcohnia sp. QZ13]|uniref:hypothetical protein n=1 Tax=Fredinandcohnia sp. QZ13 TaxID=3073144 RepID=UPI00285327EE|nr:hypothetical protein [Fredinandcohnia sp. QZ13]MDR4886789.1 hypothetical protein [Fredinandcohnia sp. QZ13]
MRKMILLLLLISLVLVVGATIIGVKNKDRDILLYHGNVYSNATDLEWFQKKKNGFQKGEKMGESNKALLFMWNFSATKLPKGIAVFSTNDTGVFIAETKDGDLLYYIRQLKE